MSILNWIEDKKRLKLLNAPKSATSADSSKGLWTRCDKCGIILYIKHLKENQRVCFGCSYHLQMMSGERIENLLDKTPLATSYCAYAHKLPGSEATLRGSTWRPLDETVSPCDPLRFYDQKRYRDRLQDAQERTGLQDAIQTGTGMIDGIPVALAVMDFSFMGGSMGSVVGEKITRLIEYATSEGLTLLIVSASGGARMQEGVFSLMQMAKISSALYLYQSCANLLYISILTSPTTGGVTASFAMLGDIIFAEPKALIAFAGRRVIEQTLSEDLPDDFQTSEYMLHHGLVDLIVPRRFLRQAVSETIRLYQNAPFKKRGQIPFGVQNPISFLTEEKIRRNWNVLTKFSENRNDIGGEATPLFRDQNSRRPEGVGAFHTKQSFDLPKVIGSGGLGSVGPKGDDTSCSATDQRWRKANSGLQNNLPLQREKSNPFKEYRKLLTSFETMLDLFVSGKMMAGTKGVTNNSLPEGAGGFAVRSAQKICTTYKHHSLLQIGSEYKSKICNTRRTNRSPKGQVALPCAQNKRFVFATKTGSERNSARNVTPSVPTSFWLYRGVLLPKQDRGCLHTFKNRVEKACLYTSRFSAKPETQVQNFRACTPSVQISSQRGSWWRSHPFRALSTKDLYLGKANTNIQFVNGKALRPRREIGGQDINGWRAGNDKTSSRVLINRNRHSSRSYKPDPDKKSSRLQIGGEAARGTNLRPKRQVTLPPRFVTTLPCAVRKRFVTRGPLQIKNLYGQTALPCAYTRKRFVLATKTVRKLVLGAKPTASTNLRHYVNGEARESFLARSSRNEIDRFSLLHSFRIFSENSALARNTVFGVSTDLGGYTSYKSSPEGAVGGEATLAMRSGQKNYLNSAYAPQKSVADAQDKEKIKTVTKGVGRTPRNLINRSAIGLKHTDYFCDRSPAGLQDKKKSYNFCYPWWRSHLSRHFTPKIGWERKRGVDHETQTWTRQQENGFDKREPLVTSQNNFPNDKSFALSARQSHLLQNRKVTTRKDDANFLNQAIELAATEGVEWRAFYIYQQLSENTGFLEDFLQQNVTRTNLAPFRGFVKVPTSQKQIGDEVTLPGNILFYKSICRNEKALGKMVAKPHSKTR